MGTGECEYVNNANSCDDGLFCNGADTCAAGTCSQHAGNPCTAGVECANVCDEAADTCNVAAGTPCTDSDTNVRDAWAVGGGCLGCPVMLGMCGVLLECAECFWNERGLVRSLEPHPLSLFRLHVSSLLLRRRSWLQECTVNECNGSGTCAVVNVASGTTCNDGDACTTGDVCNAGTCAGTGSCACTAGSDECDDANPCTDDSCPGMSGPWDSSPGPFCMGDRRRVHHACSSFCRSLCL